MPGSKHGAAKAQGDLDDLASRGRFFFEEIEDHIACAASAAKELEKRIHNDRVALGYDPTDDSAGLEENDRIRGMVFARMRLDDIVHQLALLERYWVTFGHLLPKPSRE